MKNTVNQDANNIDTLVQLLAMRMIVKNQVIDKLDWESKYCMYTTAMKKLWATHKDYHKGFKTREDFEDFVIGFHEDLENEFIGKDICSYLPSNLANNIEILSEVMRFNSCEKSLLAFLLVFEYNDILSQFAGGIKVADFQYLIEVLSNILSFEKEEIFNVLRPGSILLKSGILNLDNSSGYIKLSNMRLKSGRLLENMHASNNDIFDLFEGIIQKTNAPKLVQDDFIHIKDNLDLLIPYLREVLDKDQSGVNVLLYGLPGTGKTQLACLLKEILACEMLEVKCEATNGQPLSYNFRLGNYMTAQELFPNCKTILVFDEAEGILLKNDGWFMRGAAMDKKAWLNKMLESNPVPTIWISNSIGSLDPAFARRFDVVFEMPIPDKENRLNQFKKSGVDMLSDDFLEVLAEQRNVSPATINKTAHVMTTVMKQKRLNQEQVQSSYQLLISNNLKAQGYDGTLMRGHQVLPSTYSPQYINADYNLAELPVRLKKVKEARLCLYGPPGTGKTAYAHYLSQQLKMPIVAKKASDLMSKWFGETEKNMAAAFQEAIEQDAILLIDEADSFFQSRESANRQHEVRQVNEMLTQLERFEGVFVASTNLMDSFDKAAMRRFDMKVCFDYLEDRQIRDIFVDYCNELSLGSPNDFDFKKLNKISFLTPGDFSCVARQHRFAPLNSPTDMVEALCKESDHKQPKQQRIGFIS